MLAIDSPSILIKKGNDYFLDMAVLGPMVNDKKIKNRQYKSDYGIEDIEATNLISCSAMTKCMPW
ncbi:MAG: hypothetical protein WDO71_08360 [Bacteroidota bacterium]